MSDEQATPQAAQLKSTTGEVWHEVGKQFEVLGNSLANAFRTMWEDENTRSHMHEMQNGLETMINEVNKAIKEAAQSPQAHKARTEAGKAAQSVRTAGEKTWQETRPQLVSALRQLSAELQKTITKLEEQTKPSASEGTSDKPGD